MDFKQIKIDWKDILIDWIIYTAVDWRKISVSDSSRNIEGVHSRVVSPTYARYRIITIEGLLDRIDWLDKEEQRFNHLQAIFALQTNLSRLQEKEVYVKDNFNNERIIKAKIKEPFEYVEGDENMNWSYWRWRVVLESTSSPFYKSFKQKMVYGYKGHYWGFQLWIKKPKKFDYKSNVMILNTLHTSTPVRFEFEAISDCKGPIVVKNITTWEKIMVDTNLVAWDKLVIDSENFLITKNWVNITDRRMSGSIWINISWNNEFLFLDSLWNIYKKWFFVKAYFSNSLL